MDICCLQEVRWRGAGTRMLTGKDTKYKVFGSTSGDGDVGILLAGKWIGKVIHINRVNERLILLKILVGEKVLAIISAYAPQQGLSNDVKDKLYSDLMTHISEIGEREIIILGGDLNGHVGETTSGFENVHGGFGYGLRNAEGERILELDLAMGMAICNTFFCKRSSQIITYSSGG